MSTTANRSFRWLFWTLALCGLALDQGSKYGLFTGLYNDGKGGSITVLSGVFYLDVRYSDAPDLGEDMFRPLRGISGEKLPEVNHGALWGIGGRDQNGADFNHVFAVVSIVAAIAIVFWSLRSNTAHDGWLCMALGLILAGTLGNLYDRVVFHGVRDFLKWIYLYDFPVFNVADSCLVCGASLLLLQAFFTAPEEKKDALSATAEQSTAVPQTAEVH